MSSDINDFMGDKPKQPSSRLSNEKPALKAKIQSIVTSMGAIEVEQDHIKDVLKEIKDQHGISPKTARNTAKMMKDPDKIKEAIAALDEIQILYDTIKN